MSLLLAELGWWLLNFRDSMNIRNWSSGRKEMGRSAGGLFLTVYQFQEAVFRCCVVTQRQKSAFWRNYSKPPGDFPPHKGQSICWKRLTLGIQSTRQGLLWGLRHKYSLVYWKVHVYSLSLGMSPCLHAKWAGLFVYTLIGLQYLLGEKNQTRHPVTSQSLGIINSGQEQRSAV